MYNCKNCSYSTNRRFNLQTHYKKLKSCTSIIPPPVITKPIMIEKTTFNCTNCNYSTNRMANLQTHYERKNKCQPLVEIIVPPDKQKVEFIVNSNPCKLDIPNQCKLCDKILSSSYCLKQHEKICNGLHILQCPTCLKKFKSRTGKYAHIKHVDCKAKLEKKNSNPEILETLEIPETLEEAIERLENQNKSFQQTIETLTKPKLKIKRGALTDIV